SGRGMGLVAAASCAPCCTDWVRRAPTSGGIIILIAESGSILAGDYQCLPIARVCMAMARAFLIAARLASNEREAAIMSTISSWMLMSGMATMPCALASGWPGL